MSVYNGERYLRESVESILNQTFIDFEFIIVDDGSTDKTSAILAGYTDPRIVRLRNQTNLGLTKSLNRGLAAARGEYVARQDADDISHPDRLAEQVSFLDKHPDIALAGTAYVEMYEDGRDSRVMRVPLTPDDINEQLFYHHCFCHGAVMARRSCLEAVDGYNEQFLVAQDRDLWLRLAERYDLANLPEPLYYLRMSPGSITSQSRARQRRAIRQAVLEALERREPRSPSPLALGRFYWQVVLDELAAGNRETALDFLHQALAANPHLDSDFIYLTEVAVHRAFEIGSPRSPGANATEEAKLGFAFLSTLFSLLPSELKRLKEKYRWAWGELNAAYAFAAFDRDEVKQTRYHCLKAWLSGWPQWRNLGLLSVFLRSWRTGQPKSGTLTQ